MSLRISHTTIDAHNAYQQALWWGQLLGFIEGPDELREPGHQEYMDFSPDGQTRLLFIEVPEAKQVKNRIHLDLRSAGGSRDAEVQRGLGLGARHVADRRQPGGAAQVVVLRPRQGS